MRRVGAGGADEGASGDCSKSDAGSASGFGVRLGFTFALVTGRWLDRLFEFVEKSLDLAGGVAVLGLACGEQACAERGDRVGGAVGVVLGFGFMEVGVAVCGVGDEAAVVEVDRAVGLAEFGVLLREAVEDEGVGGVEGEEFFELVDAGHGGSGRGRRGKVRLSSMAQVVNLCGSRAG